MARPAIGALLASALAGATAFAQPAAQPPAAPPPPPPGVAPPAAQQPPPAGAQMPPPAPAKPPEWPKEIGGKTLQGVIAEMSNPDPTARDLAIRALPLFGPEAKKVAGRPLIAALNDPDPGIRITAMVTMTLVGLPTETEMRAAADAIRSAITKTVPGSAIRLAAARTLGYFGTDAFYAMSGAVALLDDPWWETRQAAAAALGRIGAPVYDEKNPPLPGGRPPAPKRPASRLAMDKLMFNALKDKSAAVRMEAAQALLMLGPPYNPDPAGYIKDVKPYLDSLSLHLGSEKDAAIKVWLMVVNIMYDDRVLDPTVAKIAGHIGAADPNVRVQALGALGVIGSRAKAAVPEVRQALLQDDELVQVAALSCLAAMKADAKDALLDVEKMKTSAKNEDIRRLAAETSDAIRGVKKAPRPEMKKDAPKVP